MRRLLVVLVGAGVLLSATPALAGSRSTGSDASRHGETAALSVLERAAYAGRTVGYRGRQRVATGRDSLVVEVSHRPGARSVLRAPPARGAVAAVATPALDARVVQLLAGAYDLAVAGGSACAGRATTVVEARRDDGRVAGRFEVDDDSGLLLRRDVYGADGRRLRSSAFVELQVRDAADVPPAAPAGLPADLRAAAAQLRRAGWLVPEGLPGGYRLFDARLSAPDAAQHVLHLAYSDGLSTTSLFAQRGALGSAAPEGFRRAEVGGRPVWVHADVPQRVVWSGDGTVWTLVSDAPARAVRDAVTTLPRDRPEADGVLARLGRGAGRLVAALSPFH